MDTQQLRAKVTDALVLVDVQNDFLPGGALAVPAGDAILEPLNQCLREFDALGLPVFATRDWHPAGHCSFREQGGPWPVHCVAGTWGAEFSARLRLPPGVRIVSKGQDLLQDAYSGFQGTDLALQLSNLRCRRVFVAGLATDYCVLATVKDALAAGFGAVVFADGIGAVNVRPEDGAKALQEMAASGAEIASVRKVIG
jgi:nicotinamidase/pyrazinamidase